MQRIMLSQEDCYCSVTAFYDRVAELAGKNPENLQYDVKKICCTKSVADEIFKYYRDQGCDQGQVGALWLCCGPKANLAGKDFVVEIEEGFFTIQE